ncbi:hypothetical protein CURTO8I2_60088 [Curtobacterium sp. 8I-2]|nr:hypothetical protein CURTO8I2_60088 [Curtobacterium sp. 8I-2]
MRGARERRNPGPIGPGFRDAVRTVRRRRDLNPRSPQRGLHLSRVVHSAGLCDVSKHSRERSDHHTGGPRQSRPDARPRVARAGQRGPPKWGHIGVVGAYPTA